MDHIESSASWMMRMPQIFNVSQFRQMMAGTPIYGYRHGGVSRDYHDIDIEENREDESNIIFSPSLDEMMSQTNVNSPNSDSSSSGVYSGLSGDSLAFTLVYVSVFTLTLVYVGVRLVRRWRTKQQLSAAAAAAAAALSPEEREERGPGPVLPPCGHAQCARAALLPYTGLAQAWIPEMLLQGPPPTHNTAVCRGRCQACRDLARPPPSYTKLFLEDQPPAYHDSIVLKEGDDETCIQMTDPSEDSADRDNNDTVIDIQEIIQERSANNHNNEDNA